MKERKPSWFAEGHYWTAASFWRRLNLSRIRSTFAINRLLGRPSAKKYDFQLERSTLWSIDLGWPCAKIRDAPKFAMRIA